METLQLIAARLFCIVLFSLEVGKRFSCFFFQLLLGFCALDDGALEGKPILPAPAEETRADSQFRKLLVVVSLGISPGSAVHLPLKLLVQLLLGYLFA